MTYQGKYFPQHTNKYLGDYNKIVYRSSWEYSAFRWCDLNPDIVCWASEETVVPYICKTDGKRHRYFVDLTLKNERGEVYLVEIKPAIQTLPPKPKRGKRKSKFLEETMTYAKNTSKWEAANDYAEQRGWKFVIWTEDSLKSMGIPIMTRPKKVK